MKHAIKVNDNIYNRLAKHAEGFETPESVIERLLNFFEKQDIEILPKDETRISTPLLSKSYSKYRFGDRVYGKGRLVLAVVAKYCEKNPNITFSKLEEDFPIHLQGSNGVFSHWDAAIKIFESTGHKRNFIKKEEEIEIADAKIAVCTEWGTGNIDRFIEHARNLRFQIEEVS